jgi:putative solute:sodium symporter small subunit
MAPDKDNFHSRTALYWSRTRRLTGLLLAVWFAATFLVVFFARELSEVEVLGWPVSFYMAAQGLILIYLAIIGIYTLRMQRLDTLLGHPEVDDEQ